MNTRKSIPPYRYSKDSTPAPKYVVPSLIVFNQLSTPIHIGERWDVHALDLSLLL